MNTRKYDLDTGWQALFKDIDVSVQDVLRHANLPLDLLTHKTPRLTADEYFRLWDGLATVLRQMPAFPVYLAQSIKPEIFNPAIFACLCSVNLNTALKRITYYKPLVGPIRMEIEQTMRQTSVTFSGIAGTATPPSSLIAFELAFWVQIARIATRERIIPKTIHTSLTLPEIATYETFFGTTIQQSEVNGLVFTAEDAHRPFLTVNDAMWSIFEPGLRKRMDSLKQEAPFRERVRACLIEILASGHYSINDVASRLAMSRRTLQRRLQAEDTNFQKVLDELREELARHYLTTSDYSSGQIAFLLGYEEPNSFFRAFRTWTGQTPEYIRANV